MTLKEEIIKEIEVAKKGYETQEWDLGTIFENRNYHPCDIAEVLEELGYEFWAREDDNSGFTMDYYKTPDGYMLVHHWCGFTGHCQFEWMDADGC